MIHPLTLFREYGICYWIKYENVGTFIWKYMTSPSSLFYSHYLKQLLLLPVFFVVWAVYRSLDTVRSSHDDFGLSLLI